jgi:hypothetical protein
MGWVERGKEDRTGLDHVGSIAWDEPLWMGEHDMNGWRASIRRHKTHCIAAEGGGAARSMEYGGLDMEQQSRLTLRSSPGALPSQQNRGITLVWVPSIGRRRSTVQHLLFVVCLPESHSELLSDPEAKNHPLSHLRCGSCLSLSACNER